MIKNWIILGDAALEDADWTLGVIDFTQSEMLSIRDIIKKYNPNITIDEIFFSQSVNVTITN